jgi:ribosome-binding factor A
MAREFSRSERVADFLQRELAQLIQMEVRDPRLGMVSVNEVRISRDMSHAKVFVTLLNQEDEQAAQDSIAVLNKAAGFLRSQIAKSNTMRTTPRLHFVFDSSVSRGNYLSDLIDQAISSDQKTTDRGSEEGKPEEDGV